MKAKRVVYGVCVIAVMTVIFLFSSQNYDETMKTSDLIVKPIENVIKENTDKAFENEKEEENYLKKIESKLDIAVRKCAHMTLFAILAIFVFLWLKSFNINIYDAIMLTLIICGLYAGFDELHQHFIDKRNARFTDVCIDEFGAIIGMCLIWFNKLIESFVSKKN